MENWRVIHGKRLHGQAIHEPSTLAHQCVSARGGEHDYIIVTDKGKPTGMIASKDIVSKIVAEGKNLDKTQVRDAMKAPLVSVEPDEELCARAASETMYKQGVRRLVVIKGGIIYGVITSGDIAQRCGDYVDKSVKDILRWSFTMR